MKKQSFKLITITGHDLYNKEGKGIPGCDEPIGWITLFTALNLVSFSVSKIPFFMTNTGKFHGLVDSSIS